jgi:uncharacterized membrane protein
MDPQRKEWFLHIAFRVSIVVKGIDGVIEIIGGLLLLIATPGQIYHLAQVIMRGELTEDPHDVFANFLLAHLAGLSAGTTLFAALVLRAERTAMEPMMARISFTGRVVSKDWWVHSRW